MRSLVFIACFVIFLLPPLVFAHSETQVIEMTPNGFEPDSVTVDQNQTIIFLNKDNKARWPASNVHPTHDIYPEFDPKRLVEPGASWSFKPKKAGTYKYHDHLSPHKRGTLIVSAEGGAAGVQEDRGFNLIDRVKTFFDGVFSRIKNFFAFNKKKVLAVDGFNQLSSSQQLKFIEEMAGADGAEKAWKYVKDAFAGQAGSSGNIHDLAHWAGNLIYQKKGFSGLADCSAEFAFGCFHGFLDKAFAKSLDKLQEAHDACRKLDVTLSGPVASCIHGIGHGVASFYSVSDLNKSLSICRKLTSGSEYCFDGVFMEFVRSAPDSFFAPDDPLSLCTDLEKEHGPIYSFSCGRNIPSLLLSRFNKSFDSVIDACRNASSKPFKEACFDSLGFSLAASADVSKIIVGCQSIQIPEFVLKCAKAAAGELVFQEVPNWQEKSEAVCLSFATGASECLAHVNRLVKEYGRTAKINFRPRQENEDPNSYIRAQMKVCYDANGAGGCYKQVAKLLFDDFGLAKTLELLRTNEGYPEVYARCHEVTHYLSRAEYEKLGTVAGVYAQCDSTCHGGCYHGTLEAFLKQNKDQEFAKVCGNPGDYQKPLEFNECLHGMGHAAMFVTEMELRQSLALCDGFSSQDQKERCYSGAFMENSSSSTSNDHQSYYLKKDDPFYPCTILEEKYLPLCWQYQSSYFALVSNQDWKKIAGMCMQIPQQYQDRCFRTIGTNQVGFTPALLTMKQDCDLMPTEHFKDICVGGVVSSLSYRFVGQSSRIVEFCALVDPQNRETCYKQMGNGIVDWDKNKEVVKRECQKIPDPQGASWCQAVI